MRDEVRAVANDDDGRAGARGELVRLAKPTAVVGTASSAVEWTVATTVFKSGTRADPAADLAPRRARYRVDVGSIDSTGLLGSKVPASRRRWQDVEEHDA